MFIVLKPESNPAFGDTPGVGLWVGGIGGANDDQHPADKILSWADYTAFCDAILAQLPAELHDTYASILSLERSIYHDELQAMHDASDAVVTETNTLLTDMGSGS